MIIAVNFQLKQMERRCLKKNKGFNRIFFFDLNVLPEKPNLVFDMSLFHHGYSQKKLVVNQCPGLHSLPRYLGCL